VSKKGNVRPLGDTKWHDDGFLEMTLRGLGGTPRGEKGRHVGHSGELSVGHGFSHEVNLLSL
jgi:hypothetical protein